MDIIPDGGDKQDMSLRKRFDREKLLAVINRDSFYLVLFLCLVLLATTAIWVTRNNLRFFSENDIPPGESGMLEDYQIEELPDIDEEQAVSTGGDEETGKSDGHVGDTGNDTVNAGEQEYTNKAVEDTEAQKAVTAPEPQAPAAKQERMIMPVVGKVIMDFGKDSLVYSKTLEQWTTHYGIDIAAKVGTPVKAVMSGTVSKIETDPMLGIMITIDHGNGIQTRYANLQNNNMVKEGQKVESGKVISGVGTTAEFEIGDEPHLHFEVLKNGEYQNPKLYLPNM